MAFYKDLTKKKMTRKDHLRAESKWEEEGARYRRSTTKADEQRRENEHSDARRPGGRPAFRGDRPPVRREQTERPAPRQEKPAERKAAPRAEARREEALLPENLLSGRNPIREAIKSGRDIEKLLVAKGDLSGTAREIVAMARERHIPIQTVERSRLDEITRNHQGMLAFASAYRYYDVEDMLRDAEEKGEPPFLVILDGITDPQNLGAVIRTAACVGAHGVIVPERRAVGLGLHQADF